MTSRARHVGKNLLRREPDDGAGDEQGGDEHHSAARHRFRDADAVQVAADVLRQRVALDDVEGPRRRGGRRGDAPGFLLRKRRDALHAVAVDG